MEGNSKEYQKFVKDFIIKEIQERFNIKTKKEAEAMFWEAIAYNLVQEELYNQIQFLIENPQEDAE